MAIDSTRRLHHHTPAWVPSDAVFHIRIRISKTSSLVLTTVAVADALLKSAEFYQTQLNWRAHLMLIMPDHIHLLVSFPLEASMRTTVGKWKSWQTRTLQIEWQDNFFDHRIRNAKEFELKAAYIRQNPVVKGLCAKAEDWPWVFIAQ